MPRLWRKEKTIEQSHDTFFMANAHKHRFGFCASR
jgi:hypothetical protein